MHHLTWYLPTIFGAIVAMSLTATLLDTRHQSAKARVLYMSKMLRQSTISVGAYWILVFILSLVVAAAIWLLLLLLIWMPSDFFQNYVGTSVLTNTLSNLKPVLYRSGTSPGITAIPLMDYFSLYTATILGPVIGLWSIWSQYHPKSAPSLPKSSSQS